MEPEQQAELARRIKWMLFFRLLLAILCMVSVIISVTGDRALQQRLWAPYYLLVFACFLNLPYLFLLRRLRRLGRFAGFQLATDLLLVSVLIYLTGGVRSNFTSLYFALLLAASSIFSLGASLLVASASAILLSVVTMAYFLCARWTVKPWLIPTGSWDIWELTMTRRFTYHLAFLVAQAVAYHLVAALSGSLARRVRQVRIMTDEILQNMSEGVITLYPNARIAYLNRRACQLLEIDPSRQALGQPIWSVLPAVVADALWGALRERRSSSFEVQLSPSSGNRPLALATSVLSDARGKFRGLNVLIADISGRRQMAQAMKRIDRLMTLSEAAAGIAHEIRNPLASIRGSAQALKESTFLPDNVDRRLLELVVSESDRINSIITDFLQFTRIRKPSFMSCDLEKILEDVVLLLQNHDLGQDADITLRAEGPLVLQAETDLLKRLFLNLGLNALQAMPEERKLSIYAYPENASRPEAASPDWLLIDFVDRGPGIDAGDRDKIFEPFYTRKPGGTGLGLAIVSRIVEAHGGTISADNLPAGGCRFRVRLPVQTSQAAD